MKKNREKVRKKNREKVRIKSYRKKVRNEKVRNEKVRKEKVTEKSQECISYGKKLIDNLQIDKLQIKIDIFFDKLTIDNFFDIFF